jgi:DNA-binding Lrp family transcriptional regulator
MGVRNFGPVASKRADYAPRALASRVGLDPKTVRTRLKRMRTTGLIQGFECLPNPRLLGLRHGVVFVYDLTSEVKEEALVRFEHIGGVTEAHDFFQGPLCYKFTYADDGERVERMHRVERMVGRPGDFVAEAQPPPVGAPLAPTDWRLLLALREDALMPLHRLAQRLEASVRTIRRRLAHLARADAYYVFPRIDPTRGGGLVYAGANVWPRARDRSAVLNRVRAALNGHVMLDSDPGRGPAYFVMGAATPSEADRLGRAVARTAGVERMQSYLLQTVRNYDQELDDLLAARVQPPARQRPSVSASGRGPPPMPKPTPTF